MHVHAQVQVTEASAFSFPNYSNATKIIPTSSNTCATLHMCRRPESTAAPCRLREVI